MASGLHDKVAIVTGSSSGIGEGIALALATQGVKVTICGRDQERLNLMFAKLVKISGGNESRVLVMQGDINSHDVRQQIIEATVSKFGRLDILVANAGVLEPAQTILNATDESYTSTMDTNVKSVFFLTQLAVPHLEISKGSIVYTSSNVSSMVISAVTLYSISKAALDQMTRCLAAELGPKGIRVNAVNPGYIPTRIMRNLTDIDKYTSEIAKNEMSHQALTHRNGTGRDVAEAVLFLVSDSAGFITGETIRLDAGRSFNGPY